MVAFLLLILLPPWTYGRFVLFLISNLFLCVDAFLSSFGRDTECPAPACAYTRLPLRHSAILAVIVLLAFLFKVIVIALWYRSRHGPPSLPLPLPLPLTSPPRLLPPCRPTLFSMFNDPFNHQTDKDRPNKIKPKTKARDSHTHPISL